ncbi:hypothetical protein DOY81_005301, partial [Sarcophaga bullata]
MKRTEKKVWFFLFFVRNLPQTKQIPSVVGWRLNIVKCKRHCMQP